MGFRSTLTTEDTYIKVPQWFLDKWGDAFHFWIDQDGDKNFPIFLKTERKFYEAFEDSEILKDIQKVYVEDEPQNDFPLVCVLLHECGGITRIEIWKDKIVGNEPTAWKTVESVNHNYCYGCSDALTPTKTDKQVV